MNLLVTFLTVLIIGALLSLVGIVGQFLKNIYNEWEKKNEFSNEELKRTVVDLMKLPTSSLICNLRLIDWSAVNEKDRIAAIGYVRQRLKRKLSTFSKGAEELFDKYELLRVVVFSECDRECVVCKHNNKVVEIQKGDYTSSDKKEIIEIIEGGKNQSVRISECADIQKIDIYKYLSRILID